MPMATNTHTTPEPLPSITELGRSLAALGRENDRLDQENLAGKSRDNHRRMHNLTRQDTAVRDLIAAMPAVSLADAVVQVGVAAGAAELLANNDWSGPGEDQRRHELHEAVRRMLLSALPLLAQAVGHSMAEMDWEDLDHIRAGEFGGEGAQA